MPKKKKQDIQEKVDSVGEKMQEILDKHEQALKEQPKKPNIDRIKLDSHRLQNKLRKNRFYNRFETFETSAEIISYFESNNLDKYGQELIAGN